MGPSSEFSKVHTYIPEPLLELPSPRLDPKNWLTLLAVDFRHPSIYFCCQRRDFRHPSICFCCQRGFMQTFINVHYRDFADDRPVAKLCSNCNKVPRYAFADSFLAHSIDGVKHGAHKRFSSLYMDGLTYDYHSGT